MCSGLKRAQATPSRSFAHRCNSGRSAFSTLRRRTLSPSSTGRGTLGGDIALAVLCPTRHKVFLAPAVRRPDEEPHAGTDESGGLRGGFRRVGDRRECPREFVWTHG